LGELRGKKFFAISALVGSALGLARLWTLFSLVHFLGIVALNYAADLVAAQWMVSPTDL